MLWMWVEAAFLWRAPVFAVASAWGHNCLKATFKNCLLKVVLDFLLVGWESGLQACVRPPGGYKFSGNHFPFHSNKSGFCLCFSLQHRDFFLIHLYSGIKGLWDFNLNRSLLWASQFVETVCFIAPPMPRAGITPDAPGHPRAEA